MRAAADFVPAVEAAPPITPAQRGKILALFREAGYGPEHRDKRLAVMTRHAEREIASTNDLNRWEASALIEWMLDALARRKGDAA